MALEVTPLVRYLRTQRQLDGEMRQLLEQAYAAANGHLRRLEGIEGVGGEIRRRQIRAAQAAINRELAKLFDAMGDTIRANRKRAAAAAIDAMYDELIPLLEAADFTPGRIDAMVRSQRATAERGVQNAMSRVSLTKMPLSEQVYKTKALASGQLDRIITNGIARGVSAKELGDLVRPFINPNVRGGVNYAANRLGRTELNNAFHGTQVQSAINSPFVEAMKWELSGSHPRPDECNEYAEGGDLEGGLWTPNNVPAKPHPNCLCWLEAVTPSRENFLRLYREGAYDAHLDKVLAAA